MPKETLEAIKWALEQEYEWEFETVKVTINTPIELVDKTREYFNINNIKYDKYDYNDLVPYFQLLN